MSKMFRRREIAYGSVAQRHGGAQVGGDSQNEVMIEEYNGVDL